MAVESRQQEQQKVSQIEHQAYQILLCFCLSSCLRSPRRLLAAVINQTETNMSKFGFFFSSLRNSTRIKSRVCNLICIKFKEDSCKLNYIDLWTRVTDQMKKWIKSRTGARWTFNDKQKLRSIKNRWASIFWQTPPKLHIGMSSVGVCLQSKTESRWSDVIRSTNIFINGWLWQWCFGKVANLPDFEPESQRYRICRLNFEVLVAKLETFKIHQNFCKD